MYEELLQAIKDANPNDPDEIIYGDAVWRLCKYLEVHGYKVEDLPGQAYFLYDLVKWIRDGN